MTDYITTASGIKINRATGQVIKEKPEFIAVPNNQQLKELVVQTNKKLSDLPADTNKMNLLSCILSYSLYGLSNAEIGIALTLSEDRVIAIKESEFYLELKNEVLANIKTSQANEVKGFLEQNAMSAAKATVDLLDSEDEKVKLLAAKDVLDRTGHKPKEDKITNNENGLVIQIISNNDNDSVTISGDNYG